jgi:prepilin-type N-terminal cleavage/methylation domain-containing protein
VYNCVSLKIKKTLGFSLIELLVVITIVGVLSSVSMSSYKSYLTAYKMSGFVAQINSLVSQSISFAVNNGFFPSPGDLGYAATVGYPTNTSRFVDPTVISTYIINGGFIDMGDWSTFMPGVSTPCGAVGTIAGAWDPSASTMDPNSSEFAFRCWYWNESGSIKQFCYYQYAASTAGPPPWNTSEVISGWTNLNSTETGYFDNPAVAIFFTAPQSLNATCQ